jgi:hypothetical protein
MKVSATRSPPRKKGKSPTVRLTSKRFGPEIKRFQTGDVVEVLQARNKSVLGRIEKLNAHELIVRRDGKGGVIRLRAAQVQRLTLLYRPLTVGEEEGPLQPARPQESWLERYAAGEVLGKDPHVLWNVRFLHNVPLIVTRTLTLNALRFRERKQRRSYFHRGGLPQTLYRSDEVKLVGLTLGYHRARGRQLEPCIGTVYLYLVRRNHTIWPVASLDRLHPADLSGESVKRFLTYEPVTLVARRPGSSHAHRVYRFKSDKVRTYRRHLEATPEPDAMRRMRAKRDKRLSASEERVRKLYKAFGLPDALDLEKRLEVSFYLPSAAEGGLHLLAYKRLIGLD